MLQVEMDTGGMYAAREYRRRGELWVLKAMKRVESQEGAESEEERAYE